MQAKTVKAIAGISAIALVAMTYFVFGCNSGDLYPLMAAILILAGKEVAEYKEIFGK